MLVVYAIRNREPFASVLATIRFEGGANVATGRFVFAAIALMFPLTAFAQRPRPTSRGPADLQRAVEIIRDWGQIRAAEGSRACRFQAVLNRFIEVDRVLDPMQPNVSLSKVHDRLAEANKLVPQDRDPVSMSLRALLITAGQIFEPHLSPDVAAQRERFHREVLEPAYRLVTPEVISFVESAQQLDLALRSVSQTESDMSALILHAIHGDCTPPERDR
jgi:hypothetical protein